MLLAKELKVLVYRFLYIGLMISISLIPHSSPSIMNSITDSMLCRRPWNIYPSTNSRVSLALNMRAGSLPRNSRGRDITIFSSESNRSFFSFAVSFGLAFFLGIPVDALFAMLVEAFLVVAFVVYIVLDSWFSVNVVLSASESGGAGRLMLLSKQLLHLASRNDASVGACGQSTVSAFMSMTYSQPAKLSWENWSWQGVPDYFT
ncbi:hypothetical protein BDR07DRAFT_1426660 [Suillus spraguei]|nr:hypothetical protein BDR07DRAFT_1426660 [Suillus spraguei]